MPFFRKSAFMNLIKNKSGNMLKSLFLGFAFILLIQFPSISNGDSLVLKPNPQHSREAMLVASVLDRYHLGGNKFDDKFSSLLLDKYLESLDPSKLYFLKSDIDKFEKYRFQLDNDIMVGNVDAAFEIYNIFTERFIERIASVNKILDKQFDFDVEEYYETDTKNKSWAVDKKSLDEDWRKMLKSQALNLKLNGSKWEDTKKNLTGRYERLSKAMLKQRPNDVFQLYMNTLAELYDPHTSYFAPSTAEQFKINMSNALEGIGARLQTDNDYTKVVEVVPGGPAFKSKQIFENDRIIGVGQGDKGEIEDIMGWRIDEVVNKIRGTKGTTVRLQLIPASGGPNAKPIIVKMVREKISLEDQKAKKEMHTYDLNGTNLKIGVITLPQFYMNFEAASRGEKDFESTTRDVKKLVEELKKEGMDALLIDLRYNGGGALTEAIDLTGLFIKDGPVVQVKNSNGSIDVGRDKDSGIVYNGPLGVLVNRFSASASEIFAGAIQDYGRGIVIGEQSYGKGTVQNLIDIGQLIPGEQDKYGQVKITLAKFYRVTGSSTQHKGVTPDIEFPSAFSAEEFGESSQDFALPWDQINAVRFQKTNDVNQKLIEELRNKHQKRQTSDRELRDLIAELDYIKEQRNKSQISLNEEKRRKENEEADKLKRERINIEVGEIDDIEIAEESSSAKKLSDAYLKESLYLLAELVKFKVG
jgi:carboxyl-terminal processing protease